MNKSKKDKNIYRWWVIGYVAILAFLTLRPFSGNIVAEKEYNMVLFRSIGNYWKHMKNFGLINSWAWDYFPGNLPSFLGNLFTVSFVNLAGNLLLFIPLGIFFGASFQEKSLLKTFLASFLVSLGIELAQFVGLSSRIADVDDVILNVIGAMLGWMLIILYNKWKKRK